MAPPKDPGRLGDATGDAAGLERGDLSGEPADEMVTGALVRPEEDPAVDRLRADVAERVER